MTLSEFFNLLENHDWFFEMSDDGRVYRRGESQRARIEQVAAESPAHKALFEAFRAHMFSGPAWGTAKQPKPERPA